MIDIKYANAYSEVLEILKYIPKEDYNKIPKGKIEVFEKYKNDNYNFIYNPNKSLEEQQVSKGGKAVIGLLFRDYWATEKQRNKIIAKQNYDRKKLEEEKTRIYNSDDIFKKKTNNNYIKNEEKEVNNLPTEIKKDSIFLKIIKFLKKLLFWKS